MGIGRLDCGANDGTMLWQYEAGTIPNGTVDLGRHSSPPNGGRCLIMYYAYEHSDVMTPTITVGGQSPDYTYGVNRYDHGSGFISSIVWVWMESTIASMSGLAISTGGTWPTTTNEAWAYEMFTNVDQTVEPDVDYQTSASVGSTFDITTTGTATDRSIICMASGAGGTAINDWDTLAEMQDQNPSAFRFCIGEGSGGDTTTTITPAGSGNDYIHYAIALTYRKYVLNVYKKGDYTNRTTTSSSYSVTNAECEIASNVWVDGRTYLLLNTAHINCASTSANDANIRFVFEGQGEINDSEARQIEPRRSSTAYGNHYFHFSKETMVTVAGGWPRGDDMQAQIRNDDGVLSVSCGQVEQVAIELDDLDSGDYAYNEDTTGLFALDNTAWDASAAVTIGDGTSDYAIYACAHIAVNSTSASIRMKVTIDGTDIGAQYMELEGEDTAEEYWIGFMVTSDAVASSVTAQIEFQTDSGTSGAHDVIESRIFALRLNAFEDYFTDYDASDDDLTLADTTYLTHTVAHTTDHAVSGGDAKWLVSANARISAMGVNTHAVAGELRETTTAFAGDIFNHYTQNGTNDRQVIGPFYGTIDLSDATSYSFRQYHEDEVDSGTDVDEKWMFGFSTVFAADAATGGEQAGSLATLGVGY